MMMLNRKLKRVPLDFDHPLGKVWSGYLLAKTVEPPKGEGYQCWETTSEGSPISPVFKTFDDLCDWLSKNKKDGVTEKFSKDDWNDALKDTCPVVDLSTKELELSKEVKE